MRAENEIEKIKRSFFRENLLELIGKANVQVRKASYMSTNDILKKMLG